MFRPIHRPLSLVAAASLLALGACSAAEDQAKKAAEESLMDLHAISDAISTFDFAAIEKFADERLCSEFAEAFKLSFEGFADLTDEEVSEKGAPEFDEFSFEVVDVKVTGDTANVTVKSEGFDPLTTELTAGEERSIVLKREDGDWKLCPKMGSDAPPSG